MGVSKPYRSGRALLLILLVAVQGCSNKSSTAPTTVTSVSITGTTSLQAGQNAQLTATAALSDGTTQNISGSATWQSSSTGVATVAGGLWTAVTGGTATLTATYQNKSAAVGVVVATSVTSLAVSATTISLTAAGQTSQLVLTATLSNGATDNVTAAATWQSSSSGVATVSNAGLVTAVSAGTATITAAYQGKTVSSNVVVTTVVVTTVAVAGTTSLTSAGQSSQLSATASFNNGTTQNVTSAATWQSSNSSVAIVSSGGLVTAITTGFATITATYQGTIGSLIVTVATPTSISSCQGIISPGRYTLTTNLTNNKAGLSCISITASNVTLDCGGHTIASTAGDNALLMSGAQNVLLSNCTLTGGGNDHSVLFIENSRSLTISGLNVTTNAARALGITIASSQDVGLNNNTVTVNTTSVLTHNAMSVSDSQHVTVSNNVVRSNASALAMQNSSSILITGNTFTGTGSGSNAGEMYVFGGNHNTISQNTIDGGWNGDITSASYANQGADDGILVGDEDNDLIQGNTISHVYDAGVETVGTFRTSTISGNIITDAGFCGVGGWYGMTWTNVAVKGNQVSRSPFLLFFGYEGNSGSPFVDVTSISFQSNTFSGNSFQAPTSLPTGQHSRPNYSVVIDFSSLNEGSTPLPLPFTGGNNLVTGNSLPASPQGFYIRPSTLVVGNVSDVCSDGLCGLPVEERPGPEAQPHARPPVPAPARHSLPRVPQRQ